MNTIGRGAREIAPTSSNMRSSVLTTPDFHAKRIILLTPGWQGASGIDRVSSAALVALLAAGEQHDFTGEVWSLEHPTRNSVSNREIRLLKRFASGSRARFASWGIKGALRSGRDTLVLCMHLHLAPVALPMVARGARLAVFLHGIEAWVPLSRLRTRSLRDSHVLLANSHFTSREFLKHNPTLASHPMTVCHLGVPDLCEKPKPSSEASPFALIVGRLASGERYKGHDALLTLWPKLLGEIPSARLVIAGDGDDRLRLEKKAMKLGLSGAVHFTGRLSEPALVSLYQDCAFFVMPSSGEGFGLVFLEAMRAGKASIGGKGAAEEVISNGASGTIVNPTSTDEIYTAVRSLFLEQTLRESMGRTGRTMFLDRFTQGHFEERLQKALGLRSND